MLTLLKKFSVSLFLTLILFATPTFAETATPAANVAPPYTTNIPSTVSPTSPLFTDLILSNMFHTFSCLGIGSSLIGQPCLTYQIQKDAQGAIKSMPVLSQVNTSGGALGTVTSVIGMLYVNPPIRTADYLASLGEGFGVVKSVHAQVSGSGANVLSPILSLWQVSRNISYLIMIIIFVIIGIMVMFRNKINPQTVITTQAALPGLVIGLILITFSYFLAALVTDLAFVGTNIVGAYFSAAQNPSPPSNLSKILENQNTISIMSTFVGATGQPDLHAAVSSIISQLEEGPSLIVKTVAGFLSYQYSYQFAELPATITSGTICGVSGSTAIFNPLAWIAGTAPVAALSVPECIVNGTIVVKVALAALAASIGFLDPATPISWALYVVLIAILMYTMFKLLLKLVNNFLSIIFYTITAPFHFLAASLPGRQGLATDWIRNMLCNVLAFPAVIGVFYFVNFLLGSEVKTSIPITGNALNLTGSGALPLFGGMDTNFIRLMMAYGALIATPTIPDIICRAIGKVGQAGQLIGQEISGGARSGQGYAGQAHGNISQLAGKTGGLFDTPGWEYSAGIPASPGVTGVPASWSRDYSAIHGGRPGVISKILGGK